MSSGTPAAIKYPRFCLHPDATERYAVLSHHRTCEFKHFRFVDVDNPVMTSAGAIALEVFMSSGRPKRIQGERVNMRLSPVSIVPSMFLST